MVAKEDVNPVYHPTELVVSARDGHKIHIVYKKSNFFPEPPVWVLLHGRTWSSIPVGAGHFFRIPRILTKETGLGFTSWKSSKDGKFVFRG